jgi:hypothetical protein
LSLEKRGDFEGSTVLSFCQGLNECKATLYREKKMKKKRQKCSYQRSVQYRMLHEAVEPGARQNLIPGNAWP